MSNNHLGHGTNDPLGSPLFVSPSCSAPSEEIVPYLGLLFPNVPERAKRNNVLLKCGELYLIDQLLYSRTCWPEYDVTIVIDQGARIEDQVRQKLHETDIYMDPKVDCAFFCCIITTGNCDHNYLASRLGSYIKNKVGHWWPTARSWETTNLMSGPVSDFYTHFTHLESFPYFSHRQSKETDSSFIEIYSGCLCKALGISPVPSLAIEGATSDDIRKLFQDCITWLAGSYLRVDTVIGVNNSPETSSVDILNFDSTVDNLLRLASLSTSPITKEALLLSAKMKASVIILHLRLLQYLVHHPRRSTLPSVDAINELLAEDIALAQSLCPDLGIRHLEHVPVIDVLRLREFSADIQNEIFYYQGILNLQDIRDLCSQLRPRDAIVCATYAIVHHTKPQTFGPILAWFSARQWFTLRGRAICTLMGTENIALSGGMIGHYMRDLSKHHSKRLLTRKLIMDIDLIHNPIKLEWIKSPHALANARGIPRDQLTQANYNPETTLDGHIKFRYLRTAGLREIAREINAPHVGGTHILVWNILRTKRQTRERPLLINQPPNRSMHVVHCELGSPLNWIPSLAHKID